MNVLADAVISLRNLILVVNVAAGLFLLGVGWAALRERRRRAATPMNQEEYLDDDAMEGPRLERMGAWALGSMAVVAVALPTYWLVEPTRQGAMDDQFLETSIEQGAELFAASGSTEMALGCADCHGPEGQGGATVQSVQVAREDLAMADAGLDAPDRECAPVPDEDDVLLCQVTWDAPALNTVFLRFSREEIERVITYGRPGTPMPAWGLEGGGPKNEQSIANIIDFIESIQVSEEEATAAQADLTDGRALFEANCARCHTKHWAYADSFVCTPEDRVNGLDDDDPTTNPPWRCTQDVQLSVVPAGGAFGPNLTNGVTLRQFPDAEDHVQFIFDGSEFEAPYGVRGVGSGRMPGFGRMLTDEQIQAIVEYERSLGEGQPVPINELLGHTETAEGGAPAEQGAGEGGAPAEQGAGEGGEPAGAGSGAEEEAQ